MVNDFPFKHDQEEVERNAYNAAFYELGFRWYWDDRTYSQLLRHDACPKQRIRHYVETHHPHLLRAYDAEFLAEAIQEKKTYHEQNRTADAMISGYFDWAQTRGAELGA